MQPYLPDGSRPTIRLGTGKKRAETASKAISDLIDSLNAGSDVEPSASTKKWLAEVANKTTCNSLLRHGLISELPARFRDSILTTISAVADEYIRTRCAGLDKATVEINNKAKRNLLDCFGDVDIKSLKKKDGREFWRWLLIDEELAENTAKQRLRYARAFFEMAIEDELVTINPFKARGLSVTQTAANKDYIEPTVVEDVIAECTSLEWEFVFALIRKVPIRIPSEIRDFTWTDVYWDRNQMLIHSPKTRRIGKFARLVPVFDCLKPYLVKLKASQAAGEKYVFAMLRQTGNPSTTAKKIVKRAGHEPWKNFFNAIRASAECDLMDDYGIRKAVMWAGNSVTTAMKNYRVVKKTDFDDSGINASEKSDAKSDAVFDSDAKNDADPASTELHQIAKTQKKNGQCQIPLETLTVSMGDTGLEPVTSTL